MERLDDGEEDSDGGREGGREGQRVMGDIDEEKGTTSQTVVREGR